MYRQRNLRKYYGLLIRCLLLFVTLANNYHSFSQNSKSNPLSITTDSLKKSVNLDRLWKFQNNDNPSYAEKDFDDGAWINMSPELKRDSKELKQFSGIGWFRYYLYVDSSLVSQPVLIDLMQSGASDVYLNGQLLGSVGSIKKSEESVYKNSKDKPIIFSFKEPGLQVLAVRYEFVDYGKHDQTYQGFELEMHLAKVYLPAFIDELKQLATYTSMVGGVFFALCFLHLLLFVFYRKATYNFYFGIYNLSIAFLAYLLYTGIFSADPVLSSRAGYLFFYAMILFSFSMSGFTNTLFGKSKLRFRIVIAIAIVLSISYYFKQPLASLALIVYLLCVVAESLFVVIKAMIKREKGAFIVGIGIVLFFAFVVVVVIVGIKNKGSIDVTKDLFVQSTISILLVAILLALPISISAYLAWQFARTNLDLELQLVEVKKLSAYTLEQEQEKQQFLENQNQILEQQVNERTNELKKEKDKSDNLLKNILPDEVAAELKEKGESKAHYHNNTTVLFTDFVNFTTVSENLSAEELITELNQYFTAFDKIIEKNGLEKIKTIGDAYLAVSGLPKQNDQHAQSAVNAALDIIQYVSEQKKDHRRKLDIRIGVHSGSLVAGIVGVKKFAYDIWGDTVNTAARMEQSSEPGRINISKHTYQLVKSYFLCEYRGKISAKGKGDLDMYFVIEKNN